MRERGGAPTMTGVEFTAVPVPDLLREHLARWVGGWPPSRPVAIVANPRRDLPGWDGERHLVAGFVTDRGAAAVGLPPSAARRVPPGIELDRLLDRLADVVGVPGQPARAVLRWSTAPTPGPDDGVWLPLTDPRVPPWLHPFGGDALVVLDDDGRYAAGVGIKRHDRFGHELAVVTAERARGRGLARRLVAQAARRVLADGAVPTYLHSTANEASARVADAAGFPDRGWRAIGFFPYPAGN
jgi:GNAT superfamily N-acetyltransferase